MGVLGRACLRRLLITSLLSPNVAQQHLQVKVARPYAQAVGCGPAVLMATTRSWPMTSGRLYLCYSRESVRDVAACHAVARRIYIHA